MIFALSYIQVWFPSVIELENEIDFNIVWYFIEFVLMLRSIFRTNYQFKVSEKIWQKLPQLGKVVTDCTLHTLIQCFNRSNGF